MKNYKAQWVRGAFRHLACHFVDANKMVVCARTPTIKVELPSLPHYTAQHIRPLAVRPLTHPERVPTPWGFSFSGSRKTATSARRWI
ncbi:hypothetical protein [Cellvibrio japonicus]|uniref:hypothetical protein n=1 Tax=Cellvibrio japonicus TaxID=155077 RepID=UPI0011D0728F|nr:hypothetical protein [Cellvibrio japonicus]QEI13856.1 hypothetical protein FY117_17625 [Cellvibrio japonicus]QEI17430.1 hypothetical protein FY116_17630 [Cellvibrio japonicus]QEI21006.1 hypothetical protein FY115_17625 [Cellvibrio japonicus]